MTRLGLKLFYLRTRERALSQQAVAKAIGVRQATLSHVEQGVSLPSAALLTELCRFYDVTPTFLLDDERGVVPLPTERWSMRNALVTTDMWIEADTGDIVELGDGRALIPLRPGARFFDEEAARLRRAAAPAEQVRPLQALLDRRRGDEQSLARALAGELRTHPRRRRRRSAEKP